MRPEKYTKCNLGKILKDKGYILANVAEHIGVSYQQVHNASGLNAMCNVKNKLKI